MNIKPKQIKPIAWPWESLSNTHGHWVTEHPGYIDMPDLIQCFDFGAFEYEATETEGTESRNFKSIFTTALRFLGWEILSEKLVSGTLDLTPIANAYIFWNTLFYLSTPEPPEWFFIGDDYGCNAGMLIEPEQWQIYVKPHLEKLINLGKAFGKVKFHSDGDISKILDDLVEMEIDAFNFEAVGNMKPICESGNYRGVPVEINIMANEEGTYAKSK